MIALINCVLFSGEYFIDWMKLVHSRLEWASNSMDGMLEVNTLDLSVQVSLASSAEYLSNENVFLMGYTRIMKNMLAYRKCKNIDQFVLVGVDLTMAISKQKRRKDVF